MMWKKCKLIMLPTEERQPQIGMIATTNKNELQLVGKDLVDMYEMHKVFGDFAPVKPYQHLYILSDEEIKDGDWFLNTYDDVLQCTSTTRDTVRYGQDSWNCFGYKNHLRKIIATTNLKCVVNIGGDTLPSISQSFIFLYIEEYNKGNKIEEVEVEYDTFPISPNGNIIGTNKEYPYEGLISNFEIRYTLKIDSNNCTSIKRNKENWNREEVEALLFSFMNRPIINADLGLLMPLNEWIEQNL